MVEYGIGLELNKEIWCVQARQLARGPGSMTCLLHVCAVMLLVAATPPPKPPARPPERLAWDVIRSTDGDFAFSMPSRPDQESRKAQGAAGSLQIPTYSCSFEESNYRLRRVRSPAEVRPDRVLTELAHLRPRYLTKSARFVKETPIVADGVIGEDLTYTFPSPVGEGLVTARTRHSINDHSYYVMTVTSPPGKPLPEAAARYLSLLTFEAVVRAQYARMTVGPRAPQPPDRPETRARVAIADSTPEEAFRTFFLAVAVGDEATLRAVAQPDAELAWLLRRRPASPEAIGQMKSRLYRITMKRLEPGETAEDGRRFLPYPPARGYPRGTRRPLARRVVLRNND